MSYDSKLFWKFSKMLPVLVFSNKASCFSNAVRREREVRCTDLNRPSEPASTTGYKKK